jgi:uncharacterized protein (TIGR02284 family)
MGCWHARCNLVLSPESSRVLLPPTAGRLPDLPPFFRLRPTAEAVSKTAASLNELIAVLNDGVEFFSEAALRTEQPEYRDLFGRLAATKQAIAEHLRAEVEQHGEAPVASGTLLGSLHQVYAELRARLSSHPDTQYVTQLEECEDRQLHAFEDALTLSDQSRVRQIAQNYLPVVRRMHHEMRQLKQHVRSAA